MEDGLTGSDWQGPNGGAIWLLVASPLSWLNDAQWLHDEASSI